jgi:putative transposase
LVALQREVNSERALNGGTGPFNQQTGEGAAICSQCALPRPRGQRQWHRAWKGGGTPDRQGVTDAQFPALLQAIHGEMKGSYGGPRMVRERRARGFSVSKARGERLICENGLQGRHKRRYKATTNSSHSLPVADNVLARDFRPSGPSQVWTSDITDLWTDEGWLYLAIVLDLFNREVVGWSLKPRMTADLVTDA